MRLILCLIIALFVLSIPLTSILSTPEIAESNDGPRVSSLELIEQSYRSGIIDYDTAIEYKALSIFDPTSLPEEFQSTLPAKSATHILLEISRKWDLLSEKTKNKLTTYSLGRLELMPPLFRPSLSGTEATHTTTHFNIHYTTSGDDAVNTTDDNTNTIPDYIESMGTVLENVWTTEITNMGWLQPPSDVSADGDTHFDVYVENMNYFGYAQPEAYADQGTAPGDNENSPSITEINAAYCYIALRNDYSGYVDTPLNYLRVTAAHEFNHAIQFGYDVWEEHWLMEATSVWVEDEVYDNIDDGLRFLDYYFDSPDVAMASETPGYHWYSDWIFMRYISEHYSGQSTVRNIWENTVNYNSQSGYYSFNAVQDALMDAGSSLPEVYDDFVVANYVMSTSPTNTPYCYEEATSYPGVFIEGTINFIGSTVSYTPSDGIGNYAADYIQINSSEDTIQIAIVGDDATVQYAAQIVGIQGGTPTVINIPMAGSPASGSIEVDISAYDTTILIVMNKTADSSSLDLADYTITVSEVSAPEADWTFMVYLDADNNLEPDGIDDLNEMELAGSTNNVNIVVQMDRSAGGVWGDDTSNGNWTGTRRYYITQDTDISIINSTMLADLGEVNMGAPLELQDFIEWGITSYPADHYAVVLWDHGSGWRERRIAGAMKGICSDDTDGDELSMNELSSALAAAYDTTGVKLDIIGFDACLMQMLEVLYQVMPYADITVGSEETVPGDGWDYEATFTTLVDNSAMTSQELATQVIDDYLAFYGTTGEVTLSAVDLNRIDELAAAVNSYAQAMGSATGDWSLIETARGLAQEYYYSYYIDLYHFAQLVNAEPSITQAVRNAASSVMTALDNAVIYEQHGSGLPDSHGLTIYYPETAGEYLSSYQTEVAFSNDTYWDEFLQAILNPEEGVTVLQSGGNFYMDNGVIRIGFIGGDGIEDFGGSPGPLTRAEAERMDKLLAEKADLKKADGESGEKSIYPGDLYVYDEDCAVFSPLGASSAALIFDFSSGYTTSIENPGPLEGVIKETGTGSVDGQAIVWERYTSLKPNQQFVTCRVVIKNEGSNDLTNIEFYQYLDMDLAGASNDFATVPLAAGDTRVYVETKYPSGDFHDNWIYQRDASQERHFGMLMRTPEDVTDFYIGGYYGESPPYRININNQDITTGDIVTGFSWNFNLSAGAEQEFYYGLAAPGDLANLKIVSNQFHAGGLNVRLNVPEEATVGDRVAISATVSNYFSDQKAITITLTLPTEMQLAPDSQPLGQTVDVSGGGTLDVVWVAEVTAVIARDSRSTETIGVTALEPVSGQTNNDSARIRLRPANSIPQSQTATGVLVDNDTASENIDLPSDTLYPEGIIKLHPSIELLFLEEVTWLIHYPYGCMEQRASILLADVYIYHYLYNAGRLTATLRDTLIQDIVSGSLDIIDIQHDDKGWGWYHSYSSTPFFTCYALKALLEIRHWADTYGITIPTSPGGRNFNTCVNRGIEWLSAHQQADGHWDGVSPDYIRDTVPLTAYMLQSLAEAQAYGYTSTNLGIVITNAINCLKDAQNTDGGWGRTPDDNASDSFSTALNVVALSEAGIGSGQTYIQNARTWLLNHQMPTSSTHYWQSGLQSVYHWFAHIPETTSFAMVALLKTGSSNTQDEVAGALDWMLENSNSWLRGSTKDGASAVWMFNQLGVAPGMLNIDVDITVNGTALPTQHFEGTSPESTTIDITNLIESKRSLGIFNATAYNCVYESEMSGTQTVTQTISGTPYTLKGSFLFGGLGVPMQGTGRTHAGGDYIKFTNPTGLSFVHIDNPQEFTDEVRQRYTNLGITNFTGFGNMALNHPEEANYSVVSGVIGASGRVLQPWYSIAVDPNVVSLGTAGTLFYQGGATTPDGATHMGFSADDTGGGITGHHIDIYVGEGQAALVAWHITGDNRNVELFTSESNTFNFTSTGTGKITYEIILDYYVPRTVMRQQPALTLNKDITSIIEPGNEGMITLIFSPSDNISYVFINDYIPGGFTLNTDSIDPTIAYEIINYKVTFALQDVNAGDNVTIKYGLVAPQVTLGQINIGGADCQLVYQPNINTSSAGVSTDIRNVNVWDIFKLINDYVSTQTVDISEVVIVINYYFD